VEAHLMRMLYIFVSKDASGGLPVTSEGKWDMLKLDRNLHNFKYTKEGIQEARKHLDELAADDDLEPSY
jgi:hypothetical protein